MPDKKPTPETRILMQQAAALRANGETWVTVAEAVKRQESTCAHWASDYPRVWNTYLVEALDNLLGTLEQEALHTARQGLRDKDNSMQAARMLLEHTRKLRGERLKITGGDGGPLVFEIVQAQKPDPDADTGEE